MQIALCDDDAALLDELDRFLHIYEQEHKIPIRTDRFLRGEDLLDVENVRETYDIIFMDIYLHPDGSGLNGTDIIRRLNLSRSQQVIFTTTSREHAVEAFGLNAAHYLVKPLTAAAVAEAMDRCLERMGKELLNVLEVKTRQGLVSIPMENIIYVEVFNKLSVIHTSKNEIRTYASLDSLSELMDEKLFMRAQRSYLVNMSCIDEFLFDRLILTGSKEIMLSRNNRAKLKQQYQTYLFNLARRGDI